MKVTIYIRDHCRFCDKALALLRKKNLDLHIVNASGDEAVRAQMIEKAGGRRTFPQIFIGDRSIGGCDDLYALDEAGQFEVLLQGEAL